MAQYFLAGVANAEIFDSNDELIATAKTLTDSSIQTSVSSEEVRGGNGAALLGKYFHTTGMTMTMTDAMFRLDYIAANIGANLDTGADIMHEETLTASAQGTLTLSKTAKPLGCDDTIYVWYKLPSASTWSKEVSATGTTISGLTANTQYCVKYIYTNSSAKRIKLNSNFVPKTLYVILTATLFAGDAQSNVGTEAGKLVIKIPRFQLDGAQELGMNMTGASTTAFSGSALAVECDKSCSSNGAYYAEIIEVITDYAWYENATGLAVDTMAPLAKETTIPEPGVTLPDVYALYASALPKKIDANALTEAGATLTYAIPSGTGLYINGNKIHGSTGNDPRSIICTVTLAKSSVAILSKQFVITIA